MEEKNISIFWEGPYAKDDIEKFTNEDLDFGLYAVYGTHPLYGIGKLLYIGKTEKQTFASRLKGRYVIEYDTDPKNIQIYLGRVYIDSIYAEKDEKEIQNMISNAEKLLINYLRPSNNSSNINSCEVKENIRLFNDGAYRDLPPELSSKRLLRDYVAKVEVRKLSSDFNREIIETDDYYGFNICDSVWIGLDYELWKNNIVLTMQTKCNKSNEGWKEKKYNGEKWFYRHIFETEEDIKKLIREIRQTEE